MKVHWNCVIFKADIIMGRTLKMNRFLLLALLVLTLAVSGCQSMELMPEAEGPDHPGYEFTQHYKHSHFAVTQGGHYSVELVFREGTLQEGLNEMDVIIHDKDDRDVTGANVSIIPYMPVHRHGVDITPMVMERGGGTYSARNVDITMAGKWDLRVRISTVMANDEAIFEFMIEPGGSMMDTMHVPHDMSMDKEIDLTSVVSARNLFNVSYEAPWPVPMNRLHSWDIWITTPSREPVTGANITVNGGMPAHGHGLPTRPVVVETDVLGKYRIDGIKFTMPGEWVVRLHIDTPFDKDTAEFILMVQ